MNCTTCNAEVFFREIKPGVFRVEEDSGEEHDRFRCWTEAGILELLYQGNGLRGTINGRDEPVRALPRTKAWRKFDEALRKVSRLQPPHPKAKRRD